MAIFKQCGAINRMLVSGISGAALATAIGVKVVYFEGDGPTSVDSATSEVIHHAYPDPAHGWSVPTICQGRTRGVVPGMTATASQCRLWLESDLRSGVIRGLARNVTIPITFNQAVELGLFMDNVGETQFRSSALLRKLNAGDCYGAAREFNSMPQIDRSTGGPRRWAGKPIVWRSEPVIHPVTGETIWSRGHVLLNTGDPVMKWTTANGVPLPGLIKRRTLERLAFEADCAEW